VLSSDRLHLGSVCNFGGCANFGQEFSVDVRVPGSFCMFYFFDSLADGYADPAFGRTDLHIFGIDPKRRWGSGKEVSEIIGRLTALFTDDGYSPKFSLARRFEEPDSLRRKSVFDTFLIERRISALAALAGFMSLAEAFDGTNHVSMADLNRIFPIRSP
jgi:hypothetical protein